MSYNRNFYNNFRQPNSTFRGGRGSMPQSNNHFMAPRPLPPPPLPHLIPRDPVLIDQGVLKQWQDVALTRPINKVKTKPISIATVRKRLQEVIKTLRDLKNREIYMSENMCIMSDYGWQTQIKEIHQNRALIDGSMNAFDDTYINMLRNILAKKSAKRMRLKRLKMEHKIEKIRKAKDSAERSRRIDENLQKIKDEINKVKQMEEAKVQADIVLREVLRKKHDAKKRITTLEALMTLRKARQNTAKGRGEVVNEKEAATFKNSIEKLKSLWIQKQSLYEKEEAELRMKLKEDTKTEESSGLEMERKILDNIAYWRHFLFGGLDPHRDFKGDRNHFIFVRSQWDQFLSSDGTSLPVGWVTQTS